MTHALQRLNTRPAAFGLGVLREPQRILRDTVCEVAVRLPAERPTTEDKLICAYAQRPPVNGIGVTALSEDLRGHVSHGPSNTGQETPLRIVHCDVEVRDVCVTPLVKEDVVRLEITACISARNRVVAMRDSPMDNSVVVEECERRADFCNVEPHDFLR